MEINQTPHFVASDLGLHCLPMSQKKDARLIWVKINANMTNMLISVWSVYSIHLLLVKAVDYGIDVIEPIG